MLERQDVSRQHHPQKRLELVVINHNLTPKQNLHLYMEEKKKSTNTKKVLGQPAKT